MTLAKSLSLPA